MRDAFSEAFLGVWRGELENDGLNALVLRAGLRGREITVVRAVAKYLRQAGIPFSDRYMERTMLGHPELAALLVLLFEARFDPEARDEARAEALVTDIEARIDAVRSLDEDRILRSVLSVIQAMCAPTTTARARTGSRARRCRSSSTRRRCRCCRGHGRSSRSSSTRRASRASTCAGAGSRAAACAGPTGARTSAPRSSA